MRDYRKGRKDPDRKNETRITQLTRKPAKVYTGALTTFSFEAP
jgi:hypothetical protein